MTSEQKKYTVHFEFNSGDGGLLSKDDFNKLERELFFYRK